ncbi:MAG: hypothetical protein DI536_02150 [Archangium gephyra]|uniref:Lipoprotein n=1 Tax=Archangium gephyra TaxID=48 RepID=A0A2W5VT13_9BACT|nr:MAG: hypothetical protein DI536_02150 [Archangium gephyra]
MNFKELLWRAARVAVPLSVLVSGCRVSLKEPSSADACDAPDPTCRNVTVQVVTSLPPGTTLTEDECRALCDHVVCSSNYLSPSRCVLASETEVTCFNYCDMPGRPPTNGRLPDEAEPWARMAWFEAQSAHEFEHLATQLEALGAPSHFVSRARAAAVEERGHARIAERRAGRVVTVDDTPFRSRTVKQLAFENFLAGCINESASAVTSAYQSDVLGDEDLRQLANEEVGHAEFSWELHEWLIASLDAAERRELAIAGERKMIAMHAFEEAPGDEAGRPSNELRRAQLDVLASSLWRPALAALLQ